MKDKTAEWKAGYEAAVERISNAYEDAFKASKNPTHSQLWACIELRDMEKEIQSWQNN